MVTPFKFIGAHPDLDTLIRGLVIKEKAPQSRADLFVLILKAPEHHDKINVYKISKIHILNVIFALEGTLDDLSKLHRIV